MTDHVDAELTAATTMRVQVKCAGACARRGADQVGARYHSRPIYGPAAILTWGRYVPGACVRACVCVRPGARVRVR
jgi:hypothetical protein